MFPTTTLLDFFLSFIFFISWCACLLACLLSEEEFRTHCSFSSFSILSILCLVALFRHRCFIFYFVHSILAHHLELSLFLPPPPPASASAQKKQILLYFVFRGYILPLVSILAAVNLYVCQ